MHTIPTDDDLYEYVYQLGRRLRDKGYMLCTAESCTGGWLGKALTDVKGSSHWYERGFITYTNQAKHDMLGVSEETLSEHGAVSENTVLEMARGALEHSRADISVAITGIAGPGGATTVKPLGTVWFAWAADTQSGFIHSEKHRFDGDREAVRRQAVAMALKGVMDHLVARP
jgi:nicotinamide-nucleotide amidase